MGIGAFLKGKKNEIIAIGMFGSEEISRQVAQNEAFKKNNIKLLDTNFIFTSDLVEAIEKENPDIAFISDSVFIGVEEMKYQVVEKIREITENIRIVMLFSEENYDKEFENWAWKKKVYDIFYAKENRFNFSEIIKRLEAEPYAYTGDEEKALLKETERKNQELLEKLAEKEKELAAEEKKAAEAVETLEKNKLKFSRLEEQLAELSLLKKENKAVDEGEEGKLDEELIRLTEEIEKAENSKKESDKKLSEIKREKEKIAIEIEEVKRAHEKEMQELRHSYETKLENQRKESEEKHKAELQKVLETIKNAPPVIERKRIMGACTIGFFSLSAGAGSTSMSLDIAEKFLEMGFKTVILGFDGKEDLKYADCKIDVGYTKVNESPGEKSSMYMEAVSGEYEIIILDFGHIYPVNNKGQIEVSERMSIDKYSAERDLLYRCNAKVGMAFSSPWHLGKLNFFIENRELSSENTIFAIENAETIPELQKCSLNISNRRKEEIFENILFVLGIERNISDSANDNKRKKSNRVRLLDKIF